MEYNLVLKESEQESFFANIIKALLIMLVVSGHMGGIFNLIGIPYKGSEIFPAYSFHMPAFIFISGYFFKLKNITFKEFLKGKISKLIIPYYIANIFYGFLTFFLKEANLFSNCKNLSIKNIIIEPWLSGYQFNLNGPAWFVLFLFLVQSIYFILKKKIYLKKDNPDKKIELILLFIFIILGIIATSLSTIDLIKENSIYWGGVRVLFGIQFYQLGYILRVFFINRLPINLKSFLVLILFKILFIEYIGNYTFSMRALLFKNEIILPLIVSLFGIYYIIHISYFLLIIVNKYKLVKLNSVFITIGSNTWSIMMHHMFINLLYDLYIRKIGSLYLDYLLLPLSAILLPIIWGIIFNRITNKIKEVKTI